MAHDQKLASRIKTVFDDLEPPLKTELKMFGGICFLTQGNIACGILDDKLIVRVGKPAYQEALAKPGTSPFDTTGRPMAGWVFVENSTIENDSDLHAWVRQGVNFALTLPVK